VAAINEAEDVFVLGAGFSAALYSKLPLANELGNQAFERVLSESADATAWRRFSLEYPFEVALSLLAEPLPHLTDRENKRNAARFAELSAAVAGVLDEAQAAAFTDEPPPWLYALVSVLHQRRSTIVSFNYDTAIETGVESHWLVPERARRLPASASRLDSLAGPYEGFSKVGATDLLWHLPPLFAGTEGPRELVKTMRLLKLHGSIDWWWVPGDPSGSTLEREGLYGRFGAPQRASDQMRRDYLPSRERFIVPPLAAKTPYYGNPVTRQLWQDAYHSLRRASRVALIGYSLPVTDMVTFGMLQSAIQGRDIALEVVNRDVDELEPRLKALIGVGPKDPLPRWVRTWDGEHSVESYCQWLGYRQGSEFARALEQRQDRFPRDASMHVGWPVAGGEKSRKVFRVRANNDVVVLETAPVDGMVRPDRFEPFDPTPHGGEPTFGAVRQLLADTDRIVAVHGDSEPFAVVNIASAANWIRFVPAGFITQEPQED